MSVKFLKGVFAPVNIGREDTLRAMERLSASTHLVSSAEHLVRPQNLQEGSLGDWKIIRDRYQFMPAWRRKILDLVSQPLMTRALHAGRIFASASLLLPTGARTRTVANAYLATSSALLYPRHNFGSDGSDQVSFQTSAVAFVARATKNERVQDNAIWYLALQDALSYAVSGWVKLFGASWRSGTAVPGVMRTIGYGNKYLWKLFKDRPKFAQFAAHGMLAFEGLFPLVLFARGRLTRPFIAASIGFHTFIAGSMGLGRFFTAFGSMLPAIAYVTNRRAKSHLVPTVTAASVGATLFGGVLSGILRSARIRKLRTENHCVTTQNGNTLYYDWRRGTAGAPVLILDHGLFSTPQHFAWIIKHLTADIDIITYWRAGYGPSINTTGDYSVEEVAHDLTDLIADLPPDIGPVFLGGHSLGGLVARRASELTTRPITGVIYLDSSHPGQLAISAHQRRGAEGFAQALTGVSSSLVLGLGWILQRPEWLSKLPRAVQPSILDQYRNSRMWAAGVREWKWANRMFRRSSNTRLALLDTPTLVITAEATLRVDDAQDRLHQELADSHTGGSQRVVIREADHDSILTNQNHAAATADAVNNFIKQVVHS
ncbi:alpha/beta fold hydrolase [Lysinibacter sp. HNR]|uniref:alpha/beta fold hydrolase n=1 Tax=Lysinibacter sp. HNR TaxID=3031408 RepID=UPI002434DCCC|nr:alpha/beta fold hydrolase [Lysinibacter sp. HNR]WGD37473.1 alpha/beta fold hydrolase [Lysinibacter sp. HNR]